MDWAAGRWPWRMRPGEQSPLRVWAYPMLLAGVAVGFDAANRAVPWGLLSSGPLDEVAHLASAALGLMVLVCFIDAPRRFYAAALVASVAIDLDHIPLYLGLLPDRGQRPVTHSLATVVVFAGAAAASRRHRAVLAGAATGLVLHFARDIAEGPPGMRIFWPVQQTAWTASYWWFMGMIIVFTAARLILVTTGVPCTRVRLFQPPSPSRSAAHTQRHRANQGGPFPDREPEASDREGSSRHRLSRPHRLAACRP
jgi:inner membrane protein